MIRSICTLAVLLGSLSLVRAEDVKVGDLVYVPLWVEGKVDNKPVKDFRNSSDQFETVEQINGAWLWLGKGWVDRKEVYSRSQLKIERTWSTLLVSEGSPETFALVAYSLIHPLGKFTQSSVTIPLVYGCTTTTGTVPDDIFELRKLSLATETKCDIHRCGFAPGATGTATHEGHRYEMNTTGGKPWDAWFRCSTGWKIFILFPVKRDGQQAYVVATPKSFEVDNATNYATVLAGSLQAALESPETTKPLKFE